MNHLRQILFAFGIALLGAWWISPACGQTSPAEGPAAPPAADPQPKSGIQYVGPDTFILLDASGRPQPVLNMSYEEFVAAWKRMQKAGQREEQPRYAIEDQRIAGTVRGEQAELNVEMVIRSIAGGQLKVPLGMEDAILTEDPRIEPLGRNEAAPQQAPSYVSFDQESGGYVAWVDIPAAERCKVSLKFFRPLVRTGNQTNISLNLPRALVSTLTLDVPERVVEATASEGAVRILSAADGDTRLAVDGPRGDFQLTWTTAGAEPQELAHVMSATGAIAINIDGHSVRSDAVLTVRSYGGSFDRIRVRLPPGAQLIEDKADAAVGESSNFRLTVAESSQGNAAGGALATVEFAEKQVGPVRIRLSTEQPLGLTGTESAVELAGFEVVGAVRQFGDVSVTVADDWQLRWENGPYVRQVERGELDESLRAAQPTVAFQYDRQPWSLRAEIVGRPMVVHVTPQYRLRIGADQAELRARLSYQVPGARAFEFRVQLNGWELTPDPIESNGLVDRDRAVVSRDGMLILPLSQASSRRAEIEFSLRRPLAGDATNTLLPLPAPEADTVATGALSVIADPAIELVPDMQASRGLAPVPVVRPEPPTVDEVGGEQFAYRSFVADALFAARRSMRTREVATDVHTQLTLGWQEVRARQEIEFDVRFQPISEIALELPVGWKPVGDQVQIVPADSAEGPLIAAVTIEPETHGRPTQIARLTLAQPRLGKFRVQADFQFDHFAQQNGAGASFLKLPQPSATQATIHRVDISSAADMAVSIDPAAEGQWHVEANGNPSSVLTLTGSDTSAELPLVIGPVSATRAPTTRVERIWLQTWQAGNVIQDRAAIRFRTRDAAAIVELPPSSTASDVEVLLDGALADASLQQEGRLSVALPTSALSSGDRLQTHTLELRYRRPAPAGLVTRLSLTPPQLVGSSGLCDVLWHVVLPGDRHVVSTPDTLSAVDPAQWLEVVFGRAAARSQAELEDWVGAAPQPGPTETQNAYLYTGLAPVSINLITAPRWLIVLVASGAVLVLASAWIYLPAARRAWIALLLASMVVGLAFAFPAQAVLVGQAAILGLALAAAALFLRRWSGARTVVAPQPVAAGSTNMRLRSSLRTDSYYAPPPASPPTPSPGPVTSHSTSGTATAPLAAPEVD